MSEYRDWKVGDRVVYVGAGTQVFCKRLTPKRIYTLRQILAHPETGEIGVLLERW